MPVGELITHFCHHKEGAKDGLAFVLADMVQGSRKGNAVKAVHGVGLDIDVGMDGEEIDRRVEALNCLALSYSTHSHLNPETIVPKDRMIKWCATQPERKLDPASDAAAQAYLREVKKYDEAIASTARLGREEHTNDSGMVLHIEHKPIPKHRIIIPFAEPYVVADQGATQEEAIKRWKKVPQALADKMGGLPLDTTGVDISRLFYLPRHARNRPFSISLFGGPLFDWRTLQLDDPFAQLAEEMSQGKSKSTTPEGRNLGRWWVKAGFGFLAADAVREHAADRVRSDNGRRLEVQCPFDDGHSNPGDPDDRACMVLNAGDGRNDGFVISCRHESCQNKTGNDMLGKWIADGVLPQSVLEDEAFNALAPDVSIGAQGADQKQFRSPAGEYQTEDEMFKVMSEHASFLVEGGEMRVIVELEGSYEILSVRAAEHYFSNVQLWRGKDDKAKLVPGFPLYMRSCERLEFFGLTADPRAPRRKGKLYATWRGFALKPEAGSWVLMRAHILNNLCNGDQDQFIYFMSWLAHTVQRPGEKLSTAVVLRGPRGCGKSTVGNWMREAIGPHHSTKVSAQHHITGAFNQHLENCLFLLVEEAVWAGSKSAEGVLKDLISGNSLMIEGKGRNAKERLNFSRLMITTNENWAIPAGKDERRFFVLNCDGPMAQSPDPDAAQAYFEALYHEANNGGVAAMLADLELWDWQQVDLRRPPVTIGLKDQMGQSLDDGAQWLLTAVELGGFHDHSGQLIDEFNEWKLDAPLEIRTSDLLQSFEANVRRFNSSSSGALRMLEVLKRFGDPTKKRLTEGKLRPPGYVLAPRRQWQERFTTDYGIVFDDAAAAASTTNTLGAGEPTGEGLNRSNGNVVPFPPHSPPIHAAA